MSGNGAYSPARRPQTLPERRSPWLYNPRVACVRLAGAGACSRPFPIQAAADQFRRARAGVVRPLLRVALARAAAGVAAPQATTLIGWFTDLPAA